MVDLCELSPREISKLVEWERSEDTAKYVIPYSLQKHRIEISEDQIYYLSIYHEQIFSGFIILALDGADSVEFRRIVVDSKGKGIGQAAIKKMEEFCVAQLKRKRVWLDVFKSNQRGQYIYKKLGYKQFKSGEHNGELLLYLEKIL